MLDKLNEILRELYTSYPDIVLVLNKSLRQEIASTLDPQNALSDNIIRYKSYDVKSTYSPDDTSFVAYKKEGKIEKIFIE